MESENEQAQNGVRLLALVFDCLKAENMALQKCDGHYISLYKSIGGPQGSDIQSVVMVQEDDKSITIKISLSLASHPETLNPKALVNLVNAYNSKKVSAEGKFCYEEIKNVVYTKLKIFKDLDCCEGTKMLEIVGGQVQSFFKLSQEFFRETVSLNKTSDEDQNQEKKKKQLQTMKEIKDAKDLLGAHIAQYQKRFQLLDERTSICVKDAVEVEDKAQQKSTQKFKKFFQYYNDKKRKDADQEDFPSYILRKIRLNDLTNVDNQWNPHASGFGKISKILTQYVISVMSINRQVNQMFSSLPKTQKEEKGWIVIKTSCDKNSQEVDFQKYFNEEVRILQHMRTLKCNQIASYYVEEVQPSEQIKTLYCSFYELSMGPYVMKADYTKKRDFTIRETFFILQKILEALIFLHDHQITHRDLKYQNIMLDPKYKLMPKLIDFGSGRAKGLKQKEKLKLATTRGFNLKFQSLIDGRSELIREAQDRLQEENKIFVKLSRQEQMVLAEEKAAALFDDHELFDMYAFGTFAKNLFESESFRGKNELKKHLPWLYYKCREQNPSRRPTPKLCYYYISKVKKLLLEE